MGLTVLCHTKFLFNILLADLLAGKDDNQVKKAYALFRKSILPFPKKHASFPEKGRMLFNQVLRVVVRAKAKQSSSLNKPK